MLSSRIIEFITPNWPAPEHIIAGTTTRLGGTSVAPYDELNLAMHVDDNPKQVEINRARLDQFARSLVKKRHSQAHDKHLYWRWLQQIHSTTMVNFDDPLINHDSDLSADGAITSTRGHVCAVLTADCLPILLSDKNGTRVAAIHAGWRGLANGIVNNAVSQFCIPQGNSQLNPNDIMAWLGPCIGSSNYPVGNDVKQAFFASRHFSLSANQLNLSFSPCALEDNAATQDKYYANLPMLATIALQQAGVSDIYGGEHCTVEQCSRFYSYRRDGVTGRMASLIFIAK